MPRWVAGIDISGFPSHRAVCKQTLLPSQARRWACTPCRELPPCSHSIPGTVSLRHTDRKANPELTIALCEFSASPYFSNRRRARWMRVWAFSSLACGAACRPCLRANAACSRAAAAAWPTQHPSRRLSSWRARVQVHGRCFRALVCRSCMNVIAAREIGTRHFYVSMQIFWCCRTMQAVVGAKPPGSSQNRSSLPGVGRRAETLATNADGTLLVDAMSMRARSSLKLCAGPSAEGAGLPLGLLGAVGLVCCAGWVLPAVSTSSQLTAASRALPVSASP